MGTKKVRELERILRSVGFSLSESGRGSHLEVRNAEGKRVGTLAAHGRGHDHSRAYLKRFFRQLGIDPADLA